MPLPHKGVVAAVGGFGNQRDVIVTVGKLVLRLEVARAAPVVKIPLVAHRPLRTVHEMDGAGFSDLSYALH